MQDDLPSSEDGATAHDEDDEQPIRVVLKPQGRLQCGSNSVDDDNNAADIEDGDKVEEEDVEEDEDEEEGLKVRR